MFTWILIFSPVLGAVFGSFINAAVFRLYKGMSIVHGRSGCTRCSYQLQWYDLIPIGSFIRLRGMCRQCQKPIPLDYVLVELIMAVLFLFATWLWHENTNSVLWLIRDLSAISILVFLFVYDFKYYLIPDSVSLPAIALFFLINVILGIPWYNLLGAMAIGFGFFAWQYVVSKGKWIGGGDLRFGALMGALLGWPVIFVGLFLAYIIGSIIAIGLLISGKKQLGNKVPFATFLSVATLISLWYGQPLLNRYLQLTGII